MLVQMFFSVRSERLLSAQRAPADGSRQVRYNLLYHWFLGLNNDDRVWDHSIFYKNRDRVMEHAVTLLYRSDEPVRPAGAVEQITLHPDPGLGPTHKSYTPKEGGRGDCTVHRSRIFTAAKRTLGVIAMTPISFLPMKHVNHGSD